MASRANLETKRLPLALASVELDGRFSGYASLFGVADLGRDIVEKGAFARSLNMRGVSGIRMLWQHQASEPIGRWNVIREDDHGLYVEGQLAKGVTRAQEALELMHSGSLDGLSIGFKTIRARKDTRSGYRHILVADLWEISVVTFPMLPQARIASIKTQMPTARQFAHWHTRRAHKSPTMLARRMRQASKLLTQN